MSTINANRDANPDSDQNNSSSTEQMQFAEATLAEFGDSWKRPKDFVEKTSVLDVTPERCEKHLIQEVTAVESRETVTVPPSKYDTLRKERVPFEQRYDLAREKFTDETVEYVCEATDVSTCGRCQGSGETDCSNCTTGQTQCGTCVGNGMETCSQCKGWSSSGPKGRISCPDCSHGTVGSGDNERTCGSCNGKGHVMCNSCSGNGEHRCTNCGGGGVVTCGTCGGTTIVVCSDCGGERELVTVEIGDVELDSASEERGISTTGVPERYITLPTGTKFKTDEEWTDVSELDTETTVRQQVERRHVDVTRIDYMYDNDEYTVFDVEGSIKAQSYPKSGTRNIVPYLFVLAFIAFVGYGMYQYVL